MVSVRSAWARPVSAPLFASPDDEPRARRPTDVALAITSAFAVLMAGAWSTIAEALDEALAGVVATLPGFLDALWRLAVWLPPGWALLLLVIPLVRRRWTLARDVVLAAGLAVAVACVAGWIIDDRGRVLAALSDVDGPPGFPPGLLVLSTAVLSTASPHLSRPYRHLGRWMIGLQFLGAVLLGGALASGGVAAVAIGLLAASGVHLVFGSPGGRPSVARIQAALAELGVEASALAPVAMQPHGVVLFEGRDDAGPLSVKVYGRDAWDGQLLATLWQLVWYRDGQRTARLSRVELVEHEGFVTLLAERAGVHVPQVITAGSAGSGDALVVVRHDGVLLVDRCGPDSTLDVTDHDVRALWSDVRGLHEAGISHGQLDLDRVVCRVDGTLGLADLSSASVAAAGGAGRRRDHAQLLALSVLLLGEERALAVGRTALDDERLVEALPYLQEAALPRHLRDALDRSSIDLDGVRQGMESALGVPDQPLIRLRRVTFGSLVNLALLAIAAYTLIGLFGDLDLDSFAEELADARWWWLAAALLLAQLPRLPSALSTLGSLAQPLPLGPLVGLQFAICYVNLAIPSTAARVAITVRFFQRFGVRPTTALSAGVIDSVSGFIIQIVLLVVLLFFSDLDFDVHLDPDQLDGLLTIGLIAVVLIVVLAVLALSVAPLRRRVRNVLAEAVESLQVLRAPSKVVQLIAGNLAAQVLFAVALAACVRAFGGDVSLTQLIVVNTLVSLFAGLLPVPGGIGVTEAGLTLGLATAGMPTETAFAAALAYRFASFYLPPLWGWFCYRWLVEQRYL